MLQSWKLKFVNGIGKYILVFEILIDSEKKRKGLWKAV